MSETEFNETPEQSQGSVSLQLVRAREEKGLSQKEVADELFLTTTFIRYIDDGEFEKIPKPAFIKGYIRSYARVVGLDGDVLVAAFEQEQNIAPQTPRIANVTESAEPPSGAGSALVQTGLAGLAALLIVALLVWWIASDDEPPPSVSAVSEVVDESPAAPEFDSSVAANDTEPRFETMTPAAEDASAAETPLPELAASNSPADEAPAESAVEEVQATDEERVAVVAEPETSDSVAVTVPETAAFLADGPDVQIERISEEGINYISVYAGGETTLEFEFSDECWVEVSDGDGVQVYADLNRAGDVMTIYGKRPFDILLGRAPAVSMTYEGDPVNLSRFTTQDDTARVRTARL